MRTSLSHFGNNVHKRLPQVGDLCVARLLRVIDNDAPRIDQCKAAAETLDIVQEPNVKRETQIGDIWGAFEDGVHGTAKATLDAQFFDE
jgi:hypothetical protein